MSETKNQKLMSNSRQVGRKTIYDPQPLPGCLILGIFITATPLLFCCILYIFGVIDGRVLWVWPVGISALVFLIAFVGIVMMTKWSFWLMSAVCLFWIFGFVFCVEYEGGFPEAIAALFLLLLVVNSFFLLVCCFAGIRYKR